MFSSIQCAARWADWAPGLTHWALALGDQPHLQRETLRRLIAFACAHPDSVCQPVRRARRGHPVILPKNIFGNLARTKADTLKQFLHDQPVAECEVDDPGLDLDLDRPEDYQKALALATTHSITRTTS